MKHVLIALIKSIALLAGIAMLVGGGLCSIITPLLIGSNNRPIILIGLSAFDIIIVIVGLLIWITIKLSSQHIKYVLLLIGALFLIGGGLCSSSIKNNEWGLFLLDIAVALLGYVLIRWWVTTEKNSLPPPQS